LANSKFIYFADLVVASAGEDCKISLWMKNGQTVGVVPQPGGEADDNIDVSSQVNVPSCNGCKTSVYLIGLLKEGWTYDAP
jgi:hypothetical protein